MQVQEYFLLTCLCNIEVCILKVTASVKLKIQYYYYVRHLPLDIWIVHILVSLTKFPICFDTSTRQYLRYR